MSYDYKILNTGLLMQDITAKLAEIEAFGVEKVLLQNPDTKAKFPVCVVYGLLQTPKYMGGAWDLSITIEVWAERLTEAMTLFDDVKCTMLELNFMSNGNTPQQYDEITKKWRFGGYFEARYNAIENTLERNV